MASSESHEGRMENLLNENEVSKQIRVSLAALRRWRLEGRGPRFIKVGSLVRYRPEELETWLASQPAGGSSEPHRSIGRTAS